MVDTNISVQIVTVFTDINISASPLEISEKLFLIRLILSEPFSLMKITQYMVDHFFMIWQNICCYSKNCLMYCLTQVLPHPVAITLVLAGTSESSKAMFCAQLL
jgi:hypothetical protein